MKKTLLVVALTGLLFGCSDDNKEGAMSATAIANFKKDLVTAQTTYRNLFKTNQDKFSITIENEVEKEGKLNFDLLVSAKKIVADSGIAVSVLWKEASQANLKNYSSTKGSASLESTADLQLAVAADDETIFDSALLSKGTVKATIDSKKQELNQSVVFTDQKTPIAIQGAGATELGSFEVNKLTIDQKITFADNFSVFKGGANTVDLKGLKLETASEFAPLFSGKFLLDNVSSMSKIELSPLLVEGKGALEKLSFQGQMGGDSYSVEIPKISVTIDAKEKNKLTSGKINYTLNDAIVDFSNKGKANFGLSVLDLGIDGINNEKAIELFQFVQAIKDRSNPSMEEIKEISSKFLSPLSKESALKILFTNKINTGDELVFNFSIKPTEKFAALAQKSVDELERELSSKSEVEAINEYLEELEFSIVVPENHLIEQYGNIAIFNNKDREEAKKEAKNTIGQSIMMISVAAATKGITPLVYEKNIIKTNISYKDQKWTINGKTLSTEELVNLGR